jgi:protein involved in ribonucleotide reduction
MSGHAIHIKLDGRTYSGTYQIDRKFLTVTTTYGRKSAEIVPRVAHETLAHQLLQELVQQEKSRKGSTL